MQSHWSLTAACVRKYSTVGLGRDILRIKLTVDFLRNERHFGSERVFFRFREVQMLLYCFVCFTTQETTFGSNCLASLNKCIHMINEQRSLPFPIPTLYLCYYVHVEAGAS